MLKIFEKSFIRCQQGAVALIFALVVPLLIAVVGGAVDYTTSQNKKTQIQNALDGAALAGAKALIDGEDVDAAARNYMQASFPSDVPIPAYTVETINNEDVKVSFPQALLVPTRILNFIGINEFRVQPDATATKQLETPIDLGIVLDRSDSMRPSVQMMINEAKSFANKLNSTNTGVDPKKQIWFVFTSFQRDTPFVTGGVYEGYDHGDVMTPSLSASAIQNEIDPSSWSLYDGNTPAGLAMFVTMNRMLLYRPRCQLNAQTCGTNPKPYMILISDGDDDSIEKWGCPGPCTIDSMCPRIKNAGINLITIALPGNVRAARMQACASNSADYYYAGTQQQLNKTFSDILRRFVSIRLKK